MNRGGQRRSIHQAIWVVSPKTGLFTRSALPFILLIFGAGTFFGTKFAAQSGCSTCCTPDCAILPQIKHIAPAKINVNKYNAAKSLVRKRNANKSLPIAWLMSFPNSGTSYTSELVRTVTGQNTASNYRSEDIGATVFEDSPDGPFWSDPLIKDFIRPTGGSLLTKTHCGGYCAQCPPKGYILTTKAFTHECLSDRITKDIGNGQTKEVLVPYSKDRVERAVHVIRDPFDNIVSRFHLFHKDVVMANETETMHPRSKEGFRAFCNDVGESFYEQEKASEAYRDVFDDVNNIPCHADFFRYIQWHNLAYLTTQDLQIPSMIIHYEAYSNNLDQTKDDLLDFLGQIAINEPPLFHAGKVYRDYFTKDEIQAVSRMFSKLAVDKTWALTQHYFDQ